MPICIKFKVFSTTSNIMHKPNYGCEYTTRSFIALIQVSTLFVLQIPGHHCCTQDNTLYSPFCKLPTLT